MNTQKILGYGARNLLCAIVVILAFAFIACGDGSGDDKTDAKLKTFTVTFDSNGGSDVGVQTITKGGKATKPADPTKAFTPHPTAGLWLSNYTFAGWQKDGAAYNFDTPVTADITLTAAWTAPSSPIDLSSASGTNIIAQSVAYINEDNSGATEYTLVLDADVENVAAITHNKDGVTLTITSVDTTERIISKGTALNGAVFIVGGTYQPPLVTASSAKLVIDGNITLQGKNSNNTAMVRVQYGGSLELKGNAKITGNTTSEGSDGVQAVGDTANRVTITMSGNAEISGNTVSGGTFGALGGGISLFFADLTMSDNAAIKNNTISSSGTDIYVQGGGVAIRGESTFTMNGGEISGNTATATGTNAYVQGGGVAIDPECSFIVASEAVKANIKNNTVTNTGSDTAAGAQVYKGYNAVFTVGGVDADTY